MKRIPLTLLTFLLVGPSLDAGDMTKESIRRIYPVADIASPTPNKPHLTDEALLEKVRSIKPNRWDVRGGKWSTDYFPLGAAIVVNAPERIQKEIEELLRKLRLREGMIGPIH